MSETDMGREAATEAAILGGDRRRTHIQGGKVPVGVIDDRAEREVTWNTCYFRWRSTATLRPEPTLDPSPNSVGNAPLTGR